MTKRFISSSINIFWYTRRESDIFPTFTFCQEHLDGERVPAGEAGKSHRAQRCPCRLDPLPGELPYHQLLHHPSRQAVVKSKHSSLHMLGLNVLPWSILELIRLQDTLTFCTPRPWHKCASGHPIWICLNLKLGVVAMLGKEGSFENDLIHSDWHFASIDKMHNFKIPHATNSYLRHYRNHNHILRLSLYWWL